MDRQISDTQLWSLFDIPSIEEGGVRAYLDAILRKTSIMFASNLSSVFVDNGAGELVCMASLGADLTHKAKIQLGVGIAGLALQHGVPLIVNDPTKQSIFEGQVYESRRDIGSSMVIPLISNDRKLGVLNLARKEDEEPFNEEDLRQANALAHQISLAVANSHLINEIQTAHDQIHSIFELLNVAVFVWNGNKIETRNPEASKLLGDGDFEEVISSLPIPIGSTIFLARVAAEQGISKKFQAEHEQTTWIITASPLPNGGVLFMIEDISFTVQTSHELARVSRLAEIGQMTAAIAHEIRNPLTGIRSAAQMIKIAPEQSEELAEIVEEEAVKLNELCSQFLEFAKPAEPNLNPNDLAELATRLANMHSKDFAAKGVELVLELQPDCIFEFDKNQIQQVLLNLMLNALQASETETKVTIRTWNSGFEVEDEGIGMEKEVLDGLFTPFFTTKPKGTGLGLSNCRKLVEAHGGIIEVDSVPGKGSRFRVRFAEDLKRVA